MSGLCDTEPCTFQPRTQCHPRLSQWCGSCRRKTAQRRRCKTVFKVTGVRSRPRAWMEEQAVAVHQTKWNEGRRASPPEHTRHAKQFNRVAHMGMRHGSWFPTSFSICSRSSSSVLRFSSTITIQPPLALKMALKRDICCSTTFGAQDASALIQHAF